MPKKGQKRKQRHEEEASDSEEVESQLLNAAPAEEDEDASDAHFEVAEYTQEEADVMARNFRKMEKSQCGFSQGKRAHILCDRSHQDGARFREGRYVSLLHRLSCSR